MRSLLGSMPCVLLSALLGGFPVGRAAAQITPQIVNGEPEFAEPTTAALLQGLDPATALVACSATLIGCDTAITTGHCFNVNASLRRTLFFQHAGFYEIESAIRHPVYAAYYDQGIGDYYEVTRQEDIALIKLVTPVSGITPSPINTTQTPGPGTPGRVVGFGRDPLTEVSSFQLAFTTSFRPRAAALLNLGPDHLDWHRTFDAYVQAKARVFANQEAQDRLVFNADPGPAVVVAMSDMRDRFRLVANVVEVVEPTEALPNLPRLPSRATSGAAPGGSAPRTS